MALSPTNAPRGDEYFQFVGEPDSSQTTNQRRFLAQCSQARTVHPGGTDFGIRNPQGPNGLDPGGLKNAVSVGPHLKLEISISQAEFWAFEPVQLDLSVTTRKKDTAVWVNNAFDPGYECFTVWIEDSRGWRRKYQSPIRYCRNFALRPIHSKKPFKRDIPLFRQAGGLTFPYPGEHTIW